MPRGKRSTRASEDTQTTTPRRGRRRKQLVGPEAVPAAPPEPALEARDPALIAAEEALIAKYPGRKIKPGTLLASGAIPQLGHKRTVVILCEQCGAERRLATSDLHHCGVCRACKKQAKKPKAESRAQRDE